MQQKSVGIIGHGQIGSRLATTLSRLGLEVKANDPPKQAAGASGLFALDEAMSCDIVSIHVPLVSSGPWPTLRLINAERIDKFHDQQIFINTSRGDVVDEQALKQCLQAGTHPTVVLDVFRNEPEIDAELASLCEFASPHIAGYSLEGKIKGTEMVYQGFCRFSGLPARYSAAEFAPEPALKKIVYAAGTDPDFGLHTAIRAGYDVRTDDSQLRNTWLLAPQERAMAFDKLRKNYRQRRGFCTIETVADDCHSNLLADLGAAGFEVSGKVLFKR